jgi:hypothetical protein
MPLNSTIGSVGLYLALPYLCVGQAEAGNILTMEVHHEDRC